MRSLPPEETRKKPKPTRPSVPGTDSARFGDEGAARIA